MEYLREELKDFRPYVPGEQPAGLSEYTKLNTNENPYPPSPKIQTAVEQILSSGRLRRYPNYSSESLRNAFAKIHHLRPEQILVTNGSDEAIRLLFHGALKKNGSLLIPEPTYSYYPVMAEQEFQGITVKRIPVLENLHLDLESLAREKADLIAFAHPNAPTGILEKREELLGFIDQFSGLVLSDEAYIDFAPPNSSLLEFTKTKPNLVVSRTLSKSYSLAGLRMGFLIGPPEIISEISKLKDSYNLGLLEQTIAETAILDQEYFQQNVDLVVSERRKLREKIIELGFSPTESAANFLFARPPEGHTAEKLYEMLKGKKILVRYFSTGISREFIRITVGNSEENQKLIEALEEIL